MCKYLCDLSPETSFRLFHVSELGQLRAEDTHLAKSDSREQDW